LEGGGKKKFEKNFYLKMAVLLLRFLGNELFMACSEKGNARAKKSFQARRTAFFKNI